MDDCGIISPSRLEGVSSQLKFEPLSFRTGRRCGMSGTILADLIYGIAFVCLLSGET